MTSKLVHFAAYLIASMFVLSATAVADDATNPAAKYRHEVMEVMGSAIASFTAVFTGRVETSDHLQIHADTLARTTALTASLFPEGSEGGHALAIIWEEPDEFAQAAQESADSTAALAAAVADDDRAAIAQAFKAVGEGCKGCHKRYREEDDH